MPNGGHKIICVAKFLLESPGVCRGGYPVELRLRVSWNDFILEWIGLREGVRDLVTLVEFVLYSAVPGCPGWLIAAQWGWICGHPPVRVEEHDVRGVRRTLVGLSLTSRFWLMVP
jgi:hypothetical protein